jgi:hypothetical protein
MRRRGLLAAAVGLVAAALLVPTAAQADPSFYATPLFGITVAPGDTLLVADAGQGIVNGDTGALLTALPGVTDVAARSGGGLWATTSGGEGETGVQKLYRIDNGSATVVADLGEFEARHNPHPTVVESNPFDVADVGGGEALVADAAGNDLLLVSDRKNANSDVSSKVKVVATFPDELVSTQHAKDLFGCPAGPPDICGLPPMIPAEAVPTSVAVGPDGAYYVGELKGFPAPLGESRVWRIAPGARNAKCGESPLCTLVLDGLTSIIDIAFGPDARLDVAQIDDASWLALEAGGTVGGSVHACDVATGSCQTVVSGIPMLTSIAFRGSTLWGAIWALVPGRADVVPLTP